METRFPPEECARVRDDLGALADGALSPAEIATVEAHLAACPECEAELALLRWLTESIHQLPSPEPTETMCARLLAQVRADATTYRVRIFESSRPGRTTVEQWQAGTAPCASLPPPPAESGAPAGTVARWHRHVATTEAGSYHLIQTTEWR